MSVEYQSRLPVDARADSAPDEISTRCREFSRQMIDEHPVAATLAVFGVGLGVGTLIGSLLADRQPAYGSRAEALGHRVLGAVRDAVPDSLRSYLG